MIWAIQFVVMVGDPVDGFTLFGPFDTEQAANDYAEDQLEELAAPWWITEVRQELDPNSFRKEA